MVTQEQVLKYLAYDPFVGGFLWLSKPNKRSNIKPLTRADKVRGNYSEVSFNGRRYKTHKLVWLYLYGLLPEVIIDHIDGDGQNNTEENLRLATVSNNSWNRRTNRVTKSGIKGVRMHKNGNYEARVMHNRTSYYLGVYPTAEQASAVVRAKREALHGEFTNHG